VRADEFLDGTGEVCIDALELDADEVFTEADFMYVLADAGHADADSCAGDDDLLSLSDLPGGACDELGAALGDINDFAAIAAEAFDVHATGLTRGELFVSLSLSVDHRDDISCEAHGHNFGCIGVIGGVVLRQ
jgi:hypothetical protein